MTTKRKQGRRSNTTIDPADIRSWHNDNHRMAGRAIFLSKVEPPSPERQKCIDSGDYAKTKFAEWGLFYIEGQEAPADFPIFDPTWGKTKIPSTTVFSVYENRKHRPKRDEQVVLILPITGTRPETMDQVWRCTYTPYLDKGSRPKKKRSSSK